MKYLFIAEKPSLMRDVQACYKNHKKEVEEKVGEIDFMALSGHVCTNYMPTDYEEWKDKTVYFGPMGCRTGFYLLLAGDYSSKDIVSLVIEMYEFIRDFKGEVPGASPKDCGNYLDMNLSMANYLGKKYLDEVLYGIDESRLVYPE